MLPNAPPSPTVIAAYEKRIEKMDREKLILAEKLEAKALIQGSFDHLFEHAMKILASPWKI